MYGRTAPFLLVLAAWQPVSAAPQGVAATTGGGDYNSYYPAASTYYQDQTTGLYPQSETVSYGTNTQLYYTEASVPTATPTSTPSDPCAAIGQLQAEWVIQNQYEGQYSNVPLPPDITFQCVQTIQLVQQDALAMLGVLRQYVAFQTTLAYLKNPPPSYQQPAVDIMGELDRITSQVQAGGYNSQYDFDQDLKTVFVRAHEGHLRVSEGISAGGLLFWSVGDSLISYSTDGKAIPKVYAYSDTLQAIQQQNLQWTSSAINSINGMDPVDYVKQLATTTYSGSIEPHGEWNYIMTNNALLFNFAQGSPPFATQFSAFQMRDTYGGDSLSITFENGSSAVWPVSASFGHTLANVASGNDIYSLLLASTAAAVPSTSAAAAATSTNGGASSDAAAATSTNGAGMAIRRDLNPRASSSYPTATALPYANYPTNPVVVQENFGAGGVVSAYILDDISVGVLVLPSFAADGPGVPTAQTYATAVQAFIDKARAANVQKVIIDLSGNGGGDSLLGYDTFKRFFPNIDPDLGIRLRATPQTDTVGKILYGFSQNVGGLIPQQGVQFAQTYLNGAPALNVQANEHLDGSPFNSWNDYFSPHTVYGDNFTATARWNLSLAASPQNGLDGMNIAGYGNNLLSYSLPPWSSSNMLLVTDGVCASTCTIFTELMKTHAGVLDVAMGGIPEPGPMQGVAGTRGSNDLEFSSMSKLFGILKANSSSGGASASQVQQLSQALNVTDADIAALPPPLPAARLAMTGSINFADDLRTNATDWPLSMTYEPSSCRLYYTAAMVQDQSQVWRAAAKVLGGDNSMCVANSVNDTGSLPNCTVTTSPGFSWTNFWSNGNSTNALNDQTACLSAAAPGYLASGHATAILGAVVLSAFLLL